MQFAGSHFLIPIGPRKRGEESIAFGDLIFVMVLKNSAEGFGEMFNINGALRWVYEERFHAITQLTDIAWPIVLPQTLGQISGWRHHAASVLNIKMADVVQEEFEDIVPALTQPGYVDPCHIQAEKEVFT